jgi:hypothetical protein
MGDSYCDTWNELKEGFKLFINICIWSSLALALCFGAGYVYLTYF